MALLEAADDITSRAVITLFASSKPFLTLAKAEMEGIIARDDEDDQKLADGIALAVANATVVPKSSLKLEPLTTIDVLGKSADEVAAEIVACLGDAPKSGCVLVLQGLSGTGKGTTVAKLQALLPRAACWSNGNVFRTLTLLAVTYCEQHGLPFSSEALSPGLLAELKRCLHFERLPQPKTAEGPPKFDVRIKGLGLDEWVSSVANTLLKDPKVSKHIPTVARVTQGEVISFAAGCAETMRMAGMNVLMEGRAQTLDYVRTPHRFELTLSEPLIIGQRRAAQRIIGSAIEIIRLTQAAAVDGKAYPPSEADVHTALGAALAKLAPSKSSPL